MCTLVSKICVAMAELTSAINSDFKEYSYRQNSISRKSCAFIDTFSINSMEPIFSHIVSRNMLFQSHIWNLRSKENFCSRIINPLKQYFRIESMTALIYRTSKVPIISSKGMSHKYVRTLVIFWTLASSNWSKFA